jgi:hypothetical protein
MSVEGLDVDRPFGSCHYCHTPLAAMGKEIAKDATLQIELHVEFQQNVLSVLRRPQSALNTSLQTPYLYIRRLGLGPAAFRSSE